MSIAITASPLLLCLETSLGETGVAVTRGGRTLAFRHEAARNRQSAELVPMIESALAESGVAYGDLDALVCTSGPGSFTGIRTAIAVIRSLALALDLPVFSASTLQLLAFQAAEFVPALPITACINAFRQHVYLQPFSGQGDPLAEAREVALDDLPNAGVTLLCGNSQELLLTANPQAQPSHIILPCAPGAGTPGNPITPFRAAPHACSLLHPRTGRQTAHPNPAAKSPARPAT